MEHGRAPWGYAAVALGPVITRWVRPAERRQAGVGWDMDRAA